MDSVNGVGVGILVMFLDRDVLLFSRVVLFFVVLLLFNFDVFFLFLIFCYLNLEEFILSINGFN